MQSEKDASSSQIAELVALVGGLAHEIKNPLSTINLTLQLLREAWSTERGHLAVRSIQKIDILLGESKRLEQLLADFLRLATPQEIELEEHDVNRVVEDVVEFVRPELRQALIEVVLQLDRNLDPLRFDVNLMKQALLNLLKNSVQAMERKPGTITLVTRKSDRELVLEVIDTGTGMSADMLSEAFKIFYSTKPDGTGLGLPMVKRIVERHGGRIHCDSVPGVGTRFTLYFPWTGSR